MNHSLRYPRNFATPQSLPLRWVQRRWQGLGLLLLLVTLLLLGGGARAAVVLTVGSGPAAGYPSIGAALAAVPSPLPQGGGFCINQSKAY